MSIQPYRLRNFQQFPGCWIRKSSPDLWPPKSPDLTSPDYFVMGLQKELFGEIFHVREYLAERINVAISTVTYQILQKDWW